MEQALQTHLKDKDRNLLKIQAFFLTHADNDN